MVSRDDGKYVLYPLYFDAKASRPPRRVAKTIAVHGPTTDEVARAALAIGVSPTIERGKHHPARWWKHEGRVLVDAVGSKEAVVAQIAEALKEARDRLGAPEPAAKTAKPGKPKKSGKKRR